MSKLSYCVQPKSEGVYEKKNPKRHEEKQLHFSF